MLVLCCVPVATFQMPKGDGTPDGAREPFHMGLDDGKALVDAESTMMVAVQLPSGVELVTPRDLDGLFDTSGRGREMGDRRELCCCLLRLLRVHLRPVR